MQTKIEHTPGKKTLGLEILPHFNKQTERKSKINTSIPTEIEI